MKINELNRSMPARTTIALVPIAVLTVAVVGPLRTHAAEHARLPERFSGLLNDYTAPEPAVVGGPYEMHGKWTLVLNNAHGTATFSAEMTMETADFANTDANHDPKKLGPHTHHISVTDEVIHNDPTDLINWKTQCPTFKPATADGFVVTGNAYVTGNGGNPLFGNPSPVTICILGGAQSPVITSAQAYVEYSNFTLAFMKGSRASSHFGTQAINGVVATCDARWNHESQECKVAVVE